MRTLVVVLVDEVLELILLLQKRARWRFGSGLLKRLVHALMSAVLLRVARLYALDMDAKTQPPHGKSA